MSKISMMVYLDEELPQHFVYILHDDADLPEGFYWLDQGEHIEIEDCTDIRKVLKKLFGLLIAKTEEI